MPDAQQILTQALMLDPKREQEFQKWAMQNKVPQSNDYDMRGFYQAMQNYDPRAMSSMNPNDQQMHFPDAWKMPNHPTFSTESKFYNPQTMPTTPTWQGGSIGNGAESWMLRRPDGSAVAGEAPWFKDGGFMK